MYHTIHRELITFACDRDKSIAVYDHFALLVAIKPAFHFSRQNGALKSLAVRYNREARGSSSLSIPLKRQKPFLAALRVSYFRALSRCTFCTSDISAAESVRRCSGCKYMYVQLESLRRVDGNGTCTLRRGNGTGSEGGSAERKEKRCFRSPETSANAGQDGGRHRSY